MIQQVPELFYLFHDPEAEARAAAEASPPKREGGGLIALSCL